MIAALDAPEARPSQRESELNTRTASICLKCNLPGPKFIIPRTLSIAARAINLMDYYAHL